MPSIHSIYALGKQVPLQTASCHPVSEPSPLQTQTCTQEGAACSWHAPHSTSGSPKGSVFSAFAPWTSLDAEWSQALLCTQ